MPPPVAESPVAGASTPGLTWVELGPRVDSADKEVNREGWQK